MANISVLGRLTRDPQQRQTQSGDVVSLNIAENTGRKDQQGNDVAVFYQASIWGKRGQTVMQYFHKGDPIYIYGDLVPRQYQGKDGVPRTALDINNASFTFVPRPAQHQNNGQQGGYNQQQGNYQQRPQNAPQPQNQPMNQQQGQQINPDDLPFDNSQQFNQGQQPNWMGRRQ